MIFNFDESNDQLFSLVSSAFCVLIKKSLPTQRWKFVVFVTDLRIHYELILVYSIREGLRLIFLRWKSFCSSFMAFLSH